MSRSRVLSKFKLETPADIQRRAVESATKSVEDFGKAHPMEWFIAYEGAVHRPAPRRFNGSFWERRYRTKHEGEWVTKLTYLRYVGPT